MCTLTLIDGIGQVVSDLQSIRNKLFAKRSALAPIGLFLHLE